MAFKKPEMDKTLRNWLSMSETDLLNHKCDLVGTGIAPVSKKPAVKKKNLKHFVNSSMK